MQINFRSLLFLPSFLVAVLTFGIAISGNLAAEGEQIYKKECALCHQKNGEGSGIYPAINKLSKEEIVNKLIGYKDGSYGGPMKAIMTPNLKNKTEDQVKTLADYIVTLKK